MALTNEWVEQTGFQAPDGQDRRLAFEWERPRPDSLIGRIARPFSIIVPWDEVLARDASETDEVVWVAAPSPRECAHFDVVYTPAGFDVTGHPGARSMGTQLFGQVELENGERVFVTSLTQPEQADTRSHADKLRSARILDADGNVIDKTGILAFGTEPNPDADDGTFVGTFLDVTRP